MSVKRYDIEAYSYFEAASWTLVESEIGDFVYASDYDELRERVAWMRECDAISLTDMYFNEFTYRSNDDAQSAVDEMKSVLNCAHKAVEELL